MLFEVLESAAHAWILNIALDVGVEEVLPGTVRQVPALQLAEIDVLVRKALKTGGQRTTPMVRCEEHRDLRIDA